MSRWRRRETAAGEPLPPTRRNTEFVLLAFAVLVPVFAYANVGLATDGTIPPDTAKYGLGLGFLVLVAHILVRFFAPYADPVLLPIAALLNGLGLVLIYRLDLETPKVQAASSQLMWSAIGVILFAVVLIAVRDHRALGKYAYLAAAVALFLMIVPVFFPAINGAKVWIRLGPFSLQPGEFAKVLLVVFFASYLATKRETLMMIGHRFWGVNLPRGRDLGPVVAVWLASVGILVLERDLGTSLLYFGAFVVMLYIATARIGWILVGLILIAVGAFVVGSTEPHVHSRVQNWLDPFASIHAGLGPDQLAQSLFCFAAGGLIGAGLGLGHSILVGFAAKSDFILATVGEELGLTGIAALFVLYALLVARGFRAGLMAPDPFGSLLAHGLSAVLAIQVFVVAGGVTALIPLTGMTMPFLAQGGSSVVTNWALIALLMKVSDRGRRPPAPVDEPQQPQAVEAYL
ncbi:FtsW/RodA/SpoVE family cell cycle protein [Embleya sp. NBC_00896]|uniref:FtsW/RodA/SpoVE family cell cycle protein n=1 Tax=Embleya sp. NBC_00896 TaxID=2975961 RepID=UPI0038654E1B|nr:FtsW/RodA/SpoVE family cell cycle protein [Embleya sp. NBC_00896]